MFYLINNFINHNPKGVYTIKLTNGGKNWVKLFSGTDYQFSSISFNKNKSWTIVGNGGTILKTTNGGTTFIKDQNIELPNNFILEQNYPNPFNPATTIQYQIPKLLHVTLKIYDILGRELATVVNEEQTIGKYEVEFNGSNYVSGIYFYQLQAGNYSSVKKMILIK